MIDQQTVGQIQPATLFMNKVLLNTASSDGLYIACSCFHATKAEVSRLKYLLFGHFQRKCTDPCSEYAFPR